MAEEFYLGYGRLEDWANIVDMREPVYATPYVESKPGQFNTRVERDYVLCAQPHGNEMHYCRMPVAITEWMHDQCMNSDGKVRKAHAKQAWDVIRKWLDDCGFQIREALPALPKDLIYTDGGAAFMGFTKERGYFIEGGE